MAKLTVYFKNKVVYSHLIETKKVRIGRDETNDVVLDSREFAPVHVVVFTQGEDYLIKQLNPDFPLILNGKHTSEAKLSQGDTITVGHYDIVYNATGQTSNAAKINHKIKANYVLHTANFQVISGANIGKIFHLNSPMTTLGEHGSGLVGISKRRGGYFASILENVGTITLNNQPLDNNVAKLHHHDILVVNTTTVQFYLH